jgi:predicted SAM-dependent methyltransferase
LNTRKLLFVSSVVIVLVIPSVWAMSALGVRRIELGVRKIVRQRYAAFSARTTVERYLASTKVRKLQIGAGTNNLPGWLNTDIEPQQGQGFLDAMKPFPIPDNSLNYVYAEQVIEHLPFEGGMVMLRESYRALAPGGKLRIATPDLRQLVTLFDQDETESKRRFLTAQLKMVGLLNVNEAERPLFVMNTYFHEWGHQFLYDRQTLKSALDSVGFRDVHFLRHNESEDPELRNVERHIYVIGSDIDEYVTMIVEATK